MRIIAGEAKGRRLFAPSGEETRPTSDKIKGSLFNILGSRTADAVVLDLFGGTGALGLEALSRGARLAVISDKSHSAFEAIRRNAEPFGDRAKLLKGDYRTVLDKLAGMKFDLVFLDPPYRMSTVYREVTGRLYSGGLLADNALIVCERTRELEWTPEAPLEIYDTRTYGDTCMDYVRRRQDV